MPTPDRWSGLPLWPQGEPGVGPRAYVVICCGSARLCTRGIHAGAQLVVDPDAAVNSGALLVNGLPVVLVRGPAFEPDRAGEPLPCCGLSWPPRR